MSGVLVAFEGVCIGAFADGAGQLGNGDNVESAVGEGGGGGSSAPWGTWTVAAPVDSIIAGRFDRRRHCRRRRRCRLLQLGGRGQGRRGHPPSVAVFADVVGGGGAVPAAERARSMQLLK